MMGFLNALLEPNVPRLASRKDVNRLVRALRYPRRWTIRRDAAIALGNLRDTRSIEPLIAALQDEEAAVRVAGADALWHVGDTRCVTPLLSALKDRAPNVRAAAARALGEQLDDVRAVEPLLAARGDDVASVGMAAWDALRVLKKRLGDARCIEPLLVALKDNGVNVRAAAARALGALGDTRCVNSLIYALQDSDSLVRRSAASALGLCGGASALRALEVLLTSEGDLAVREEARAAHKCITQRLCTHPRKETISGPHETDTYCAVCGKYLSSFKHITAKGAIGHAEMNVNTISRRQWKKHARGIFGHVSPKGGVNTTGVRGATPEAAVDLHGD